MAITANYPYKGGWVQVMTGTFAGRIGFWEATLTGTDANPTTIGVRSRDSSNQLLTVNWTDVKRPVDFYGGR